MSESLSVTVEESACWQCDTVGHAPADCPNVERRELSPSEALKLQMEKARRKRISKMIAREAKAQATRVRCSRVVESASGNVCGSVSTLYKDPSGSGAYYCKEHRA
jgi:hypothetical protein